MKRIFDKWIEILENTPESMHCFGRYFDKDGRRCAVGLLFDVSGFHLGDWGVCWKMAKELGKSPYRLHDIVRHAIVLNDEKKADFKEIARELKKMITN